MGSLFILTTAVVNLVSVTLNFNTKSAVESGRVTVVALIEFQMKLIFPF